jgi:NADPH-ferrihemoprotein reductase
MLLKMSTYSEEGKAMYNDWVIKSSRTVLHVLEDLDSVRPPLDHLLELLPRLQPRFYSISSSPKVTPDSVHVTAVMVDYDTSTGRRVKGVCTDFLLRKQPDVENANEATVLCYVRKSAFRLPPKPETPFIMIGPGTGLAPFRGFIQERDYLRREGKPMGDCILYYGCRNRNEDYLYREELEQYESNGTLSNLYVAFSREQKEKVYVTHLLSQNKDQVWDVIGKQNGHLYICGDARNMARQVKDIILDVIQEKGAKSRSEAESFFKKMESNKRYAADVWS